MCILLARNVLTLIIIVQTRDTYLQHRCGLELKCPRVLGGTNPTQHTPVLLILKGCVIHMLFLDIFIIKAQQNLYYIWPGIYVFETDMHLIIYIYMCVCVCVYFNIKTKHRYACDTCNYVGKYKDGTNIHGVAFYTFARPDPSDGRDSNSTKCKVEFGSNQTLSPERNHFWSL